MGENDAPLVGLGGITKRFPGVTALDAVDLQIRAGEVVGLAGENGSGKSALVKILAGRYRPDEGSVTLEGRPVRWAAPAAALGAGIALVSQEVLGHPDLSVAENLYFGRMPRRGGVVSWAAARRGAEAMLDDLGLEIDPDQRLGRLALHHQHMIAIGKMVGRQPRLLVLDEPTASLNLREVETVCRLVERCREQGSAVVYVSHRLEEYFRLCSRVVVLRDGVKVAELPTASSSEPELIRSMVGREVTALFDRPERSTPERSPTAPPALEVRDLGTARKLDGVSFSVAAGEVVGIAGQAGAGRSSVCHALFGAIPSSGEVLLDGQPVRRRSARDAVRAGFGYVPEDRKGQGLALHRSVAENLTMPSWGELSRVGFRSPRRERRVVEHAVERLRIRTPSAQALAGGLSGGNQQKIVIGRWLRRPPRVLILDEPTRGIDVGAKDEIYKLVDEFAAAGMAVVVCSSELLELLRLSDRIVVMAAGRVVGEQPGDEATEESITAMAFAGLQEEATDRGV